MKTYSYTYSYTQISLILLSRWAEEIRVYEYVYEYGIENMLDLGAWIENTFSDELQLELIPEMSC